MVKLFRRDIGQQKLANVVKYVRHLQSIIDIYNDAFYAVNEKAKQQLANYEPVINVLQQER